MKIPVIDLFAGPGGLGEGFSSVFDDKGERVFNIRLSIEKDEHAHKTLRLRSFYRQFKKEEVPEQYYSYIMENDSAKKEELFAQLKKEFEKEWKNAEKEAWHYELPYKKELKKKRIGDEVVEYEIGFSEKQIKERHKEIDKRIKNALSGQNEKFLLIGGPPCQAYSLVGRARNQGLKEEDHRVHLYKEYLRIIAKHHPVAFVMENVKGLLSAKVDDKKMFDLIKNDLKDPNSVFKNLNSPKYRVFSLIQKPDSYDDEGFPVYTNDKKYLIKSEDYGIPQRRHRVILLGIREDIEEYRNITSLVKSEKVNLEQIIGALPKIRSGIGREIIGTNEKGNHVYQKLKNTDYEWKKAVLHYFEIIKKELKLSYKLNINGDEISMGADFVDKINDENYDLFNKWYHDPRLKGVLNHESRTHLKEDFARYLFSSIYLKENGDFPRLHDYPNWLLPKHKNAKGGKFTDRFRTQKPNQPATTVTSHISKDGHYFIHYDPEQCRSLTVREAARIQTFPDNYYFCGSRTHQYHQVGNAVPPYLARQIAQIVYEIFKK